MRIDMEKLRTLAALPDDRLWEEVKTLAGSYGFSLCENPPSHEELEKLRDLVAGAESGRLHLSDALHILNRYGEKRGGRGRN